MPRKLPAFATSLKDMPDEILLHILMYGDYATFANVSKTCRDFHQITTNPEQADCVLEFLVNRVNLLRSTDDDFKAQVQENESRELAEYAHALPSKAAQMEFWRRRGMRLNHGDKGMKNVLAAFDELKHVFRHTQTYFLSSTHSHIRMPASQALEDLSALIDQVVVDKEMQPGTHWGFNLSIYGMVDGIPPQKLTTTYRNANAEQLRQLLAQLKSAREATSNTGLLPVSSRTEHEYAKKLITAIDGAIKRVKQALPKPSARPGCSVM